jgi:hypothetical protein
MPVTVTDANPGLRRCPRCHGPMFKDDDSARLALLCLLCGEYLFPSPPPRRPTVRRADPARRVAGAPPAA